MFTYIYIYTFIVAPKHVVSFERCSQTFHIMCIYIYIYIHTYTSMYVYIYIHTWSCRSFPLYSNHSEVDTRYIHIYIYAYKHMHTYVRTVCTYIHTHTYIHTYIHTHRHTDIHTYIHICIYIYIHISIHIWYIIQIPWSPPASMAFAKAPAFEASSMCAARWAPRRWRASTTASMRTEEWPVRITG